jgi:hypothetical protein
VGGGGVESKKMVSTQDKSQNGKEGAYHENKTWNEIHHIKSGCDVDSAALGTSLSLTLKQTSM